MVTLKLFKEASTTGVFQFESMGMMNFLRELKAELSKTNKKLYVAVHPVRKPNQAYYDGYDYKDKKCFNFLFFVI